LTRCTVVLLGLALIHQPVKAQTDGERFAGDPLLIGAGARSLALGGAYVALSDDATSVYWNAAGLARLDRGEVQAQHTEQFGGTVNHDLLTLSLPTRAGGLGAGLIRVSVDGIKRTQLENEGEPLGPDNRPEVLSKIGTSDYALYLGFGKSIRPRLRAGATIKVVWRNLAVGSGSGFGFDAALQYAATPNLMAGFVIRDVTRTRISFDTGSRDEIPPSILAGLAYVRPIASISGTITASLSLHFNEDAASVESSQVQKVGLEYAHTAGLAFRLGLDGDHLTAGAGIRVGDRFGADLAFLENGDLDNTFRISASVYF
jgi:hypothetical protein